MSSRQSTDKKRKSKRLVLTVRNGFSHIAAWQFAGFMILLLLVWFNELFDLAAFFLGEPAKEPNLLRACLASGAVLVAAIIVVGNTFLQQRAILSEALTICSYCHKIALDSDVWENLEAHLHANPLLKLTHGICPDCIEKVRETWAEEDRHARRDKTP